MNQTAFFTVAYPAAKNYLDDFFVSLENQSAKEFDLVVFNDGVEQFDFFKYDLNVSVVSCQGSPAGIREEGINYLIDKGYDYVVFGDSDDYFDRDRVRESLTLLQDHDIIVNDLTLVDVSGGLLHENYLSERLTDLAPINPGFIDDKNIFGLSNTAIRLGKLHNVVLPKILIAVDWYLFSLLLKEGASAIFSNRTTTFYRQYEDNIAGFQEMDCTKALRGVRCKALHYSALSVPYPQLRSRADSFNRLLDGLSGDEALLKRYTDKISNTKIDCTLWWEQISLPEEFHEVQVD